MGRETGVTPSSQGFGEEERVGILESNLRQVDDRIALVRKSYFQCWADLALRYDWSLWEHLPENTMVKIIGEEGAEWEEIKRRDLEPEFDIVLVGGNQEELENEAESQKKQAILDRVLANPLLISKLNPSWVVEESFRRVGYTEEQIRNAMDIENYGNQRLLSKAARVVTDILGGKEPEIEYEVNQAFVQKLINSAKKLRTRKPEVFDKIMVYVEKEMDILEENLALEAASAPSPLSGPAELPAETPSIAI